MKTEEMILCPVCRQTTSKIKVKDWKSYTLFRCDQCDVIFSQPFIAGDSTWYEASGIYQLAKYYKKLYWHHDQFLAAPPPGRTLLDVGCNNGVFLHYAEKLGYEVTGMDFNPHSLEAGRQAFGLKRLHCCTLGEFMEKFPGEKFDVITVFEVLEHLDEPNEFIENVKGLLNPGGYIVVSLPNRDMMINPLGDSDYPPHHLTKWSFRSIENFVRSHGCTVVTHNIKGITAEDFARWLDYNVIRKFDNSVRKRVKGMVAQRMEKTWQDGETRDMPLLYKMRTLELAFLRGLFWPVALIFRLAKTQGMGQYVLAKIDS